MSVGTGTGITGTGVTGTGSPAEAAAFLRGARSVWIGTHSDPDGDAIGSMLGLAGLLDTAVATVVCACRDPLPEDFRYLPGAGRVGTSRLANQDVAVAVDCGDFERLGGIADPDVWAARRTLVLDHHRSNTGFADLNVILPEFSSTSEIVLALADSLRLRPDAATADALLLGVVTDTLGFRTTSTDAESLRGAARLVELGADLPATLTRIYASRPLSAIRLHARAVERLEVRGRVAVSSLGAADLLELMERPEDVRGISSYLLTVRELDAAAVVRQREPLLCDVSMRSRAHIDLVPAALQLGGGGHPQAAGASIRSDLPTAIRLVWEALAGLSILSAA